MGGRGGVAGGKAKAWGFGFRKWKEQCSIEPRRRRRRCCPKSGVLWTKPFPLDTIAG